MTVTLKNTRFEAVISSTGAELHSLKELATGTEYIWCGDPAVWRFHAPMLFPYVGRFKDGMVIYDKEPLNLTPHGFIRDIEHAVTEQSATRVVWEVTDSPATMEKYPFHFKFTTEYHLTETGLVFRSTVTNTDSVSIRFSLGSHTAIICPRNTDPSGTVLDDYYLEFEKKEIPCRVLSTDTGFLAYDADGTAPVTEPYADITDGIVGLHQDKFGSGHILTGFASDWVALCCKKNNSRIKVNTAGYPYLVLWQNAGTPRFVCIEPWFGIPDPDNTDHYWSRKPGLIDLEPGKSFTTDQSITVDLI